MGEREELSARMRQVARDRERARMIAYRAKQVGIEAAHKALAAGFEKTWISRELQISRSTLDEWLDTPLPPGSETS